MSNVVAIESDPINYLSKIEAYLDSGKSLTALEQAEKMWGRIDSWLIFPKNNVLNIEQILIAARLYSQLGNERRSDSIILRSWRKNKQHPKLVFKVLFYMLQTKGPIFASEFYQVNKEILAKDHSLTADVYGFLSIVQRLFKNFTKSDGLLSQALALDSSLKQPWLNSLQVYLLLDQEKNELAEDLAHNNFKTFPVLPCFRAYIQVLQKNKGVGAALKLFNEHVEKFESSAIWLEYAYLLADSHRWEECEKIINSYESLVIEKSKVEVESVNALKAQISIDKNDLSTAIEILEKSKRPYWKIVLENLKKADTKVAPIILNVPFLRQEHLTCAPTSLAAIAQYWNKNHQSKDIAEQICFNGTPTTLERKWLRDNDFEFKEFDLTFELAVQLIDSNIPFTLTTVDGMNSHLQVVIGYNAQMGTLYIMDPSYSSMQEILAKETIEQQIFYGGNCFAIVPIEQSKLLSKFNFKEHELYGLYDKLQIAIDSNNSQQITSNITALEQNSCEHKITLRAKREVANWSNETHKLLELNNQISEKFPRLIVIERSKFYCLKRLGSRKAALDSLIKEVNEWPQLDLLILLFDEVYDTHDEDGFVLKLLNKLKLIGAYNAQAHWSIANYYWSHQQFAIAQEHYLIAHCLDDTASLFIESYFKASRFLKNEDASLSFLKLRYEKYQLNSVIPAISIFRAYTILDQEHKGFEYLYKALKQHPEDIELINFLACELIRYNLLEQLDKLSVVMKKMLSEDDYLDILASKNLRQGNNEEALEHYKRVFEKSPLNYSNAQSYFDLLSKNDEKQLLDNILNELLELNPNNTLILDYISYWHSKDGERESALEQLVKLTPEDTEVIRRFVYMLNKGGKQEQGLEVAQQLVASFVGDVSNIACLANAYLVSQQQEQAITTARKALTLSIDNELAFDTLLDACESDDSTMDALTFVFEQLSKQVTLGEVTWNYWFAAKTLQSVEQLQLFVDFLIEKKSHLWYSYSISAMFYTHINQLDKAEFILLEGIEKFPFTPRLHYDLGTVYESSLQVDKAINAFYSALEQNPAWAIVAKELSELLEKNNRTLDAKKLIEKSIKHTNDDYSLYGFLADIEIRLDQPESAMKSLTQAVILEHNYPWAWGQLIALSEQLGNTEYANELAKKLTDEKPHSALAWRSLAYVTPETVIKREYYLKSIECDNKFVPSYSDLIELDLEIGNYQNALEFLSHTPWQDRLPFDLTSLKATVLFEIGEKEQAISILKQLLFSVQGHSYLWDKLYGWIINVDDIDLLLQCVDRQVNLNPHDPEALCKAGEQLNKYSTEQSKQRAFEYIERAYLLAPNALRITLIYLDNLIEAKEYAKTLSTITDFCEFDAQSSFILAREVFVLCAKNEYAKANEKYTFILENTEANYWVLNKCYEALHEHYSEQVLLQIFDQKKTTLTHDQAFFWGDKICYSKERGPNYLTNILGEICTQESFNGMLSALLSYCHEQSIKPQQETIEKYLSKIIVDEELTSSLVNIFAMQGHFHSVIWMMGKAGQIELPAYCYYHWSFALQMSNKWDEAGKALIQALNKPVDNCIHNIKLWYTFERYRKGKKIEETDLHAIHFDELVSFERYIFTMLLVVIDLADNVLEDVMDELKPKIWESQREYVKTDGQYTAKYARKLLKQTLTNASGAKNLFDKFKTKLWLFNRF